MLRLTASGFGDLAAMTIVRNLVGSILLITGTMASSTLADVPAGTWLGEIDAGAIKLRLGMEVVDDPAGKLSVVIISIDQGGARIDSVDPVFTDNELTIPLPSIGGKFVGKISENQEAITGKWTQGGAELPLKMKRVDRLPTQRRPQEPKPPYPYDVEEVTFDNSFGNHSLAGTLTLPQTPPPHAAIVLVTGSGPQDRDETLLGHKPFAVLADAITRRGVAVLRFDDRGVGKSTGDFSSATTKDLATDALSAVRYLAKRQDIHSDRIGLGGHSEGAIIAPMVAATFPNEVAILVLLAPPAITGEEIIISQGHALDAKMMADAATDSLNELRRRAIRAAVEAETDADFEQTLGEAVDAYVDSLPEGTASDEQRNVLNRALATYRTPWFRYFLSFDCAKPLRRVRCPLLAVLGENDLQVVPDANLPPLRAALSDAPTEDVTIELRPGLNHLFQQSETGLPSEYGMIEQTIEPATLELVVAWIASQFDVE